MTQITEEFDLRQVPEYRHMPASGFVQWYHDLLMESENCKDESTRELNEREIEIAKSIIRQKYAINNTEYLGKFPESIFKLIKLKLFHPIYQLKDKMGKRYKVNIMNKQEIIKGQPILFVTNMSTPWVVPIIREAINAPLTFLLPQDANDISAKEMHKFVSRGGHLYNRHSETEREEASEYITSVMAKGGHCILLPGKTTTAAELPFEWDFADMAKKVKVEIMPVATGGMNGDFYVNMSKPIQVSLYDSHSTIYENVRNILTEKDAEIWQAIESDGSHVKKR